jgi:hypothetical protein
MDSREETTDAPGIQVGNEDRGATQELHLGSKKILYEVLEQTQVGRREAGS